MPTQLFTGTGTASYYKMGPTPLLLNALHGQVGGQPKKLSFLNSFFGGGAFSEVHMLIDEFRLQ